MEGGYWTDASLDALSTCSDAEDSNPGSGTEKPSQLFSPSACSTYSVEATCTPVNQSSAVYFQYPKIAYVLGSPKNHELSDVLKFLEIECRILPPEEFNINTIDSANSIVIFEEFAGNVFEAVRRKSGKLRIYGCPLVLEIANVAKGTSRTGDKVIFPVSKSGYPVYSRMLKNTKISVTGIRTKDDLAEIRRKIIYLDGTYLERESPSLTHLIAAKCRGNKYRDAVALDKPILKPEWINFLWTKRNDNTYDIINNMAMFKVRAFYGAKIALEGFEKAEKTGMIKLIIENEGQIVDTGDLTATHIVKNTTGVIHKELTNPLTTPRTDPDNFIELDGANTRSPLKRPRFEVSVVNDLNETNGEGKSTSDVRAERAKILKAEWFWTSIQIEACADENAYQLHMNRERDFNDDTLNNSIGTPNSFTSPMGPLSDTDGSLSGTPGSSASGRRKRKRLMRDFVSSLAQVDHPKSIMEVDEESLDLDVKPSSEESHDDVSDNELTVILKRIEKALNSSELKHKLETFTGKSLKRLNEYAHLVETERNYVSILMNIIKLFKEPCEQEDQKAGRLLTSLEIKTIFNPILPIYSLHKRILKDMLLILESYNDESLVGQIYVKNAQEMRKCYEPFVEYFETVKNEIIRCETENPRFMAFLRIAQGKPQCGKEKLVELIIRPVQRLPSTALILKSLEKNTEKTNPDYEWITKGVEAIDRVNQTINQKKERADARVAMFDIYHEVEGCPVELISDHRTLLKKYDVLSMNDGLKNELLTLIVFTDHFQIVKRRSLGNSKNMSSAMSLANLRSPAVSRKSFMHGPSSALNQKRYKFLEWINFCHVKKIVNIHDMEPRSFAFLVREPDEVRERFLMFTVPEDIEMEKFQKISVVEFFAKQLSHSVARVDYENFITTVDAATIRGHESSSVFEKVGRLASKTSKKVGRALSLSRTPSKIKRTMSQMMSPFASRSQKEKDPDSVSQSGSETSITPMRKDLSTMSLWFGSKRGTLDGQSTPKTRKVIEKDSRKGFSVIQET